MRAPSRCIDGHYATHRVEPARIRRRNHRFPGRSGCVRKKSYLGEQRAGTTALSAVRPLDRPRSDPRLAPRDRAAPQPRRGAWARRADTRRPGSRPSSPSSASAEARVARPSTSSTGNRCSAYAARCAASSGDSTGTLYSSSNSATAFSLTDSQPSTLVRPDSQKTPAMPKRAASASRSWPIHAVEPSRHAVVQRARSGGCRDGLQRERVHVGFLCCDGLQPAERAGLQEQSDQAREIDVGLRIERALHRFLDATRRRGRHRAGPPHRARTPRREPGRAAGSREHPHRSTPSVPRNPLRASGCATTARGWASRRSTSSARPDAGAARTKASPPAAARPAWRRRAPARRPPRAPPSTGDRRARRPRDTGSPAPARTSRGTTGTPRRTGAATAATAAALRANTPAAARSHSSPTIRSTVG